MQIGETGKCENMSQKDTFETRFQMILLGRWFKAHYILSLPTFIYTCCFINLTFLHLANSYWTLAQEPCIWGGVISNLHLLSHHSGQMGSPCSHSASCWLPPFTLQYKYRLLCLPNWAVSLFTFHLQHQAWHKAGASGRIIKEWMKTH